MSICRVVSWVVGKECLLWLACFLDKTLLAFALLHFVLQGQTYLLLQVSLDFLLLHSNCLWLKGHLFLVLVLEGLGASLVAQLVKNLPAMWETWVRSLGWEDPLEKGKATHSSILAWRSPWGHKWLKWLFWLSDFNFREGLVGLYRTCQL